MSDSLYDYSPSPIAPPDYYNTKCDVELHNVARCVTGNEDCDCDISLTSSSLYEDMSWVILLEFRNGMPADCIDAVEGLCQVYRSYYSCCCTDQTKATLECVGNEILEDFETGLQCQLKCGGIYNGGDNSGSPSPTFEGEDDDGLSTVAIVGIVIVVVLLIAVLVFFIVRACSKASEEQQNTRPIAHASKDVAIPSPESGSGGPLSVLLTIPEDGTVVAEKMIPQADGSTVVEGTI